MAKLEIRNISKTYQASEGKILDNISLTVEDGSMAFLLGPSGCGKSTLLRILAGLISADSGSILLDGRDITALPPEKRNMPMVFQNYALWPHMDVFDNIAFGLKMMDLSGSDIKKRVSDMLELVQMSDFIHRKIPSLSGGQQQRIALARALALDPAVLLLDEPLSNLDAKLRDTMRFEIRRICKERKLTAVYVTHDRKEALSMADQVAILEKGDLSQCGSPREIYLHPANRFCASFLGDVNLIEADCIEICGDTARFKTASGLLLEAACGGGTVPVAGKPYTLAFRPETVRCDAGDLQVILEHSSFLGESTYRRVRTADGTVFHTNEYAGTDREDGGSMTVLIPADRITILEK